MPVSLSGRSFLKLLDFTPDEIRYLIKLGHEFKRLKMAGVPHRYLEGKNIVLLFEKTSTRTRCSFEVAGHDLGMGVIYLDPKGSQMGKKESVADTARVLGRMFDGIEYRGFGQEIVEELAAYAGVPVWNGLTTEFHPTQMIADMMTIEECFPQGTRGLKLVFMGDAQNNVANSLMVVCAKLGLHFVACGPAKQMPAADLVERCRAIAAETGGSVELEEDPRAACTGAHVVYTDVWVSMGEPDELWAERIELLSPYRVTCELMDLAADDAIFMHCLPAYHDAKTEVGARVAEKFGVTELEVTDEVFEGPRSVVFDEAENRMHSIKAVMYATLK
ncbi:MAG TPA: ornithine carbamoyltransferase [Candidatus Aphodovivens avistercoris]|nr:ornithine carbamoyltransferase [Candidatus Aphodovivens avistercoris]